MKLAKTSCIAVVGIALFCVSGLGCSPLSPPTAPLATEDDPATAESDASSSGAASESEAAGVDGGTNIGRAGNASSAAGGVSGGRSSSDQGSSGQGSSGQGSSGQGSSGQGSSGMGAQTSPMAGTSGAAAASAGAGGSGCPPAQLSCDGACVPDDHLNCGACKHDCTLLPHVAGNVRCSVGACLLDSTSCGKGWAHCLDDPETGCETDITQPQNCGACGVACDQSTPMCAQGVCVSGCPANLPTRCGDACVDTQKDPQRCGDCETACTTTVGHAEPVCQNGRCDFACTAGFMKCGDRCVDLKVDAQNCGSCNNACSGGTMCTSGACTCPSRTHECSGRCVPDDSATACGSSCEVCRSGVARAKDVCTNGRCDFECNTGTTECRGACVSLTSDRLNCGFCGNACSAEESCTLGLCTCPVGQHNCGGRCVSSSLVGSCGLSCVPCTAPSGFEPTCDGAFCGTRCTTGTKCGNVCVNTNIDWTNCGTCGRMCPLGDGACALGMCFDENGEAT